MPGCPTKMLADEEALIVAQAEAKASAGQGVNCRRLSTLLLSIMKELDIEQPKNSTELDLISKTQIDTTDIEIKNNLHERIVDIRSKEKHTSRNLMI